MSKLWGTILSIVVAVLVIANVALWMSAKGSGDGTRALRNVAALSAWAQKSTPEIRLAFCDLQFRVDSLVVTAHGGHVTRPVPFRCPITAVPSTDPPKCCP